MIWIIHSNAFNLVHIYISIRYLMRIFILLKNLCTFNWPFSFFFSKWEKKTKKKNRMDRLVFYLYVITCASSFMLMLQIQLQPVAWESGNFLNWNVQDCEDHVSIREYAFNYRWYDRNVFFFWEKNVRRQIKEKFNEYFRHHSALNSVPHYMYMPISESSFRKLSLLSNYVYNVHCFYQRVDVICIIIIFFY